MFSNKYNCKKVSVSKDDIKRVPSKDVEEVIKPKPVEVTLDQPIALPPQKYAQPTVLQYPSIPTLDQSYPRRPVFITENIKDAYGSFSRYIYPTPYNFVSQCWEAIAKLYGVVPSERRTNSTCTYGRNP